MQKQNSYNALLIKRKNKSNNLIFERLNIQYKGELEQLYKYLNCTDIDIQERVINNKIFDFIFDGEYLINGKSQNYKNAVAIGTKNGEPLEIIYGHLIICGCGSENGYETSLTETDINDILKASADIEHIPTKSKYQMINYCFEIEQKSIKESAQA